MRLIVGSRNQFPTLAEDFHVHDSLTIFLHNVPLTGQVEAGLAGNSSSLLMLPSMIDVLPTGYALFYVRSSMRRAVIKIVHFELRYNTLPVPCMREREELSYRLFR